ncbi:tetratricopeptide repeat protein [Williamwhitmania taraxaci]|uniref:Tetratricopeptide repeat-containing protein n=1 Tax=Williamwhitmania taraxaci TaxID=1640674 RepID=A0A1G6R4G2_9BACT|nr:tetratricopeptide repeat protein [Williamwhitmania taraxaci]SDC99184.1 Tetratricopeptide repeat-containing protein [Williamwhitmania taraxaci]
MKRLTLLAVFLLSVLVSNSQDYTKLIAAFSDSYAKEKAEKYGEAVTVMKGYYDEKSYEINLRLGWLTYLQGQFAESINYYGKAIELMPYAIEPRFGLALPASAMGNWNLVLVQYNKILAIDPNNTVTLYRMGLISYDKKDYKQAYQYFEKVSNLYPFDYQSLLMLAWTNLKLGKTREAKILFNKVLLYSPQDASAKEGLGIIK